MESSLRIPEWEGLIKLLAERYHLEEGSCDQNATSSRIKRLLTRVSFDTNVFRLHLDLTIDGFNYQYN